MTKQSKNRETDNTGKNLLTGVNARRRVGTRTGVVRIHGDAKNHFSNFIIPGKPPHQQLLEKLNKAKAQDTYRFEDISPDGKRSYCGLPMLVDAPPRPSDNAFWNGNRWKQ